MSLTVTFDQFNACLLNKSINFSQKRPLPSQCSSHTGRWRWWDCLWCSGADVEERCWCKALSDPSDAARSSWWTSPHPAHKHTLIHYTGLIIYCSACGCGCGCVCAFSDKWGNKFLICIMKQLWHRYYKVKVTHEDIAPCPHFSKHL